MTARVNEVYSILEHLKDHIEDLSNEQGVSALLLWLMVRQQADYELLLLEHPIE